MFDATSRYATVADYTVNDAQGRPATVKKIRFLPDTQGEISRRIVQGDRPDLLAFEYYRAPELFWRIADANQVMDPGELVAEPGSLQLIPPRS